MAYTINYSGGTITIADGTLNVSTSLSIPGRNYAGYGGPVDQNLVSLLENFAYYTASPPNPIKGQVWFDTTTNVLKYNIGVVGSPNWKTVAGVGNDVTFHDITATGDITAAGNISAGSISADTISAVNNLITGVQTGIIASGTTQGTAYSLTKDISVIADSVDGVDDGVRLPTTTCGNRITVINQDTLDSVKVYPAGSSQINSLGPSIPYVLAPGARLDFVSISNTQWYTLNATFG